MGSHPTATDRAKLIRKFVVEISYSSDGPTTGATMPAIFDLLYREYCRARLAEMRKQLLITGQSPEILQADCDAAEAADRSCIDKQHEIGHGPPN